MTQLFYNNLTTKHMKTLTMILALLASSSFISCEKDSYSDDIYQQESIDETPIQSKRNKTNKGRSTPHV